MKRRSGAARALPWLMAGTTVGLQIAYPLVDGASLRRVTVAVVVVFAATCVVHAWVHRGGWWAIGLLVVTAGGGFAAEAVGLRRGLPFGEYEYAGTLGPELLDVPLVVPLAWTMMAYPVLLAARRLTRVLAPVVGAYGLAAWDVFLDPQMVADGRWRWADPEPGLPGVPGVPLTNYAGWLAVGFVMMLVLTVTLPRDDWRSSSLRHGPSAVRTRRSWGRRDRRDESVPAFLLAWTWLGYVLGNLFWFGTPSVALVGGVLLGLLVVPYLWALWRER